jgi:dienelactone hydrolase
MKRFVLTISLLFVTHLIFAQKPPLQLESYKEWPQVDQFGLSNDGKYAYFSIDNRPTGKTTWTVKSIEKELEKQFIVDWSGVTFSEDSRQLYAQLPEDTLLTLNLSSQFITKIPDISSYKLFMLGKTQWIATTGTDSKVTFKRLNAENGYSIDDVANFIICVQGTAALIQTMVKKSDFRLQWLNIETGKITTIYEGIRAQNLIFDNAGKQAAFTISRDQKNEIWYYSNGAAKASLLADPNSTGIEKGVNILAGNYWGFSWDNSQIFFDLLETDTPKKFSNPNLTVWSHNDFFLPTDLEGNRYSKRSINAINLVNGEIIKLVNKMQNVVTFNIKKDKYLLIRSFNGRGTETRGRNSVYVCDIKTGKQMPIATNTETAFNPICLSPENKYVVYFDAMLSQYRSYCIANGKTIVLLMDSSQDLIRSEKNQDLINTPGGICGWLPDDKAVLLSGVYDLLQVAPDGSKKAIPLIIGGGCKNHVIFNIPNRDPQKTFGLDGKILLSAFNVDTKAFGFYNYRINDVFNFKDILFNNIFIPGMESPYNEISDGAIAVSKNKGLYLIKFEKYNQAPNIFFTKDFKDFKSLSAVRPENAYNWIIPELHTYQDSLGNSYQGVLYKPENFDSTKVYPVIFNYYITKSNELNRYLSPSRGGADINAQYLVSNGYVVFKIDIFGEFEKLGDGVMLSVNAAADHLSSFKWIDPKKMAIAGHSFGAYETNYIVTHSNRFAAAVTAAGVSDLVSSSNDISDLNGFTRQDFIRLTAYKVGKTLDQDANVYIKNSPIFYAKNVTTPLLILHNPDDRSVRFNQGVAFFTQLRTLKKPVWMLSYKGETHAISNEENAIDYYTRLKQFLDHYLMDKPVPDWMK